jgi:twinkle protein
MSCVEKLPHECGTKDGLQVFENDGKHDGWCFSCSSYVPDPYGDRPDDFKPAKRERDQRDVDAEISEISRLPVVPLPDRQLEQFALEYFGVKIGLSETDGVTPVLHYYPYQRAGRIVGYKARIIENKRMWVTGTLREVDLFGWDKALATGAKRLYITEGELDAVALYQALKNKSRGTLYSHYDPAVVSLPSGAGSARKVLTDKLQELRANFKEIVLVFDKDEQGQLATEDALQILPHAQTVTLPGKDANDCVMQGRSMALCNAVLFKAEIPKNTRLVNAKSLYAAGRIQSELGLSWPWPGLTKLTRGIRFGETIYLGAGVKMGKSEVVNTIAAHLIVEHDLKVFLAKPEEANRKTVQMVLGKVVGKFFHDPEIEFDYEAYDEAAKKVGDKLMLLSLYQHLGWDSLRGDIMAAVAQGAKAVFIDPITNLTNGIASGQANTQLQEIAQELAAMAKDLDIVVFIFCHLKAPESGVPHERGGKVFSHQFAGSRAMMRSCNLMLGLEGSKDPDLEVEQRNMRRLVILEDREFGASGVIPLYWDWKTSLFNEIQEKNPN